MQLRSDLAGAKSLRRWPTQRLLAGGPRHARAIATSWRAPALNRSSWDEDAASGDGEMQDSLVDLLRAEIQKENFKAEIREDVKGKQEQLRKMGEEILEQLDREAELDRQRSELDINMEMSDTMAKFNELEEEINKWKRVVQADRQELAEYEAQSAAARSKGLFFKTLHQPDKGEVVGDVDGAGIDRQRLEQTRSAVVAPAEVEVASPLRFYLFTYMTAVLLFFTAWDLLISDSPSLGLDAIYAALAAILGLNLFNERKLLAEQGLRQQGGGDAGGGSSGGSGSQGA